MAARPARYDNMQSAARFPLRLPVAFHLKNGEQPGETRNISANGVLLQVDAPVAVGAIVEFEISMPSEILGAPTDVVVSCRGRIVRSFEEESHHWVGVVIDEYKFERR